MLSVEHVHKAYRVRKPSNHWWRWFMPEWEERQAVTDISLEASAGECIGLVGPNGAGKSTLVKLLCGILHPDRGHIRLFGLDPQAERKQCLARMAVVFGQRHNLWWDLPLADSFRFGGALYQLPDTDYRAETERLKELFTLEPIWQQPVRTLSLGQRARAQLALALLHKPQLLLLDEPTIGLDAPTVAGLLAALEEINRQRQALVLVTSHDLGLIEKLCNRMLLINRGQMIFDGAVTAAKRQFGDWRLMRVTFAGPPAKALQAAMEAEGFCAEGNGVVWQLLLPGGGEREWAVLALLSQWRQETPLTFTLEEAPLSEVVEHASRQ